MIKTINQFSGPLGGMLEKGVLAFFMFAAGKGWIPGDSVAPLAAALYGFLSLSFTAAVQSETAKIQAINANETNGVKVVPETSPGRQVDQPLPTKP